MTDYWFKPHAYGYGATPVNWKGWAAVAGYIAVVLALALSLAALPTGLPDGPGAWQLATSAVIVAALTLGEAALRGPQGDQPAQRWRFLGAQEGLGSVRGTPQM